jgi:hypothetical protein
VIVVLESDGIHYWCSSPVATRELVERGARIVAAGQRAEDLGPLVTSAIPAEEPAVERRRAPRG